MSDAALLDAIGSPRRREILRLVWNGELSAGSIHRAMPDVTFGAVSQQLGYLLKAGLLEARQEQRNRYYRANKTALGPAAQILESIWDDALGSSNSPPNWSNPAAAPNPSPPNFISRRTNRMPELPHRLERTVVIRATPEIVYRFFTDSARWASWWGAGSTIEGTPGGKVCIRHANGVEVLGEVREAEPLRRIVFTYGYASGNPIPPGGSLVTISLEEHPDGTRLSLVHEFAEPSARDLHIQGWRFQLSLFGNVAANEACAGAQDSVDAWFSVWQMADAEARNGELARIAVPEILFRDRYSLLEGREDVSAHIAAALRFMPGIGLRREGGIRHCQGTVLADWAAAGADGIERMSGTSVFLMRSDGRIASVTGLTNPA